jgi:hypothetical protein
MAKARCGEAAIILYMGAFTRVETRSPGLKSGAGTSGLGRIKV